MPQNLKSLLTWYIPWVKEISHYLQGFNHPSLCRISQPSTEWKHIATKDSMAPHQMRCFKSSCTSVCGWPWGFNVRSMAWCVGKIIELPSGKLLHKYGKSPFSLVNQLCLWPFSIAVLVYQRVNGGFSLAMFDWRNLEHLTWMSEYPYVYLPFRTSMIASMTSHVPVNDFQALWHSCLKKAAFQRNKLKTMKGRFSKWWMLHWEHETWSLYIYIYIQQT